MKRLLNELTLPSPSRAALMIGPLVLAGLMVMLPGTAHSEDTETRYVIDKLLVGIYDQPADGAERLGLYPSGTRLELLERGDGYERVRTPDAVEGWIKSVYLGDTPTAALQLAETETQLSTLEQANAKLSQQIEQFERDAVEAERLRGEVARLTSEIETLRREATAPANASDNVSPADGLVQENTELKSRVASLRLTVSELEEKVATFERQALDKDARAELSLATAEIERLKAALDTAERGTREADGGAGMASKGVGWRALGIAAVMAFILGGLGGIYLTDYANRRRHGGFRV